MNMTLDLSTENATLKAAKQYAECVTANTDIMYLFFMNAAILIIIGILIRKYKENIPEKLYTWLDMIILFGFIVNIGFAIYMLF